MKVLCKTQVEPRLLTQLCDYKFRCFLFSNGFLDHNSSFRQNINLRSVFGENNSCSFLIFYNLIIYLLSSYAQGV